MDDKIRELVVETVKQTKIRSDWKVVDILKVLGITHRSYYRWVKDLENKKGENNVGKSCHNVYKILPEEGNLVIEWALRWPNLRHRELAWRLVDKGVVCVSPSVVYRILKERGLIKRWEPTESKNYRSDEEKTSRTNQRWQTDISYLKIDGIKFYLIFFIDEFSRYIVHWELLLSMDGDSVALAAQAALDACKGINVPPEIQSDNGSAYISREFKIVLSQMKVGHHKIHPYCPEENGIVERVIRTVKGEYIQQEITGLVNARERIAGIVRWYNEERLHSSLHFLRPLDYYKGNPEELLEERKQKLIQARQRRKKINIGFKKQIQKELPTIASASLPSFAKKARSALAHVDNSKNDQLAEGGNRTKTKEPICATLS